MRTKRRNTLTLLLDLLNVKYTKSFADKSYLEQPNNHNLYGLSKMLDLYNIPNAAFKAEDKEEVLNNLEPPFVAHLGNSFNVITKIDDQSVHYVWDNKPVDITREQFLNNWGGVAMVAEPDENSAEPNYIKNQRKAQFELFKKWTLATVAIILFVLFYIKNSLFGSLGINIMLALNILGSVIAFLLLAKDLYGANTITDKLCTILHNSDCNSSVDKPGSKIMGFAWSEIGFGYFTANILLLLLFPHYMVYIALLNILVLPYTLWSIWYQKFKARQWCALCLFTQLILWLIFAANLIFGYINTLYFDIGGVLITVCLYIIACLTTHYAMHRLQEWNAGRNASLKLRRFKGTEEVFKGLLCKDIQHDIPRDQSKIIFGNPDAEMRVTVLTNPHCAPCARAHKIFEHILSESDNIQVEYIFTSFDESLDSSSEYLIGTFMSSPDSARDIYNKWFEEGRINRDEFFEKYPCEIGEEVKAEYKKHKEWRDRVQIFATPTLLVNGYLFPSEEYDIEELSYFL